MSVHRAGPQRSFQGAKPMPLRVACQMDPIDRIDIKGDSTFALLLEAQQRGHKLSIRGHVRKGLQREIVVRRPAGHDSFIAHVSHPERNC